MWEQAFFWLVSFVVCSRLSACSQWPMVLSSRYFGTAVLGLRSKKPCLRIHSFAATFLRPTGPFQSSLSNGLVGLGLAKIRILKASSEKSNWHLTRQPHQHHTQSQPWASSASARPRRRPKRPKRTPPRPPPTVPRQPRPSPRRRQPKFRVR